MNEPIYEGRAFCDGAWLEWHQISAEVYANRQKWPRDGYEVRRVPPSTPKQGEGE